MKLNKPVKVLVGLATVWVAIYPIPFFLAFWRALSEGFLSIIPYHTPMKPLEGFPLFVYSLVLSTPAVCVTALVYLALIVFYLTHLRGITEAPVIARLILGIGIIILPLIAMPAYYLLFILPQGRLAESKISDVLRNKGGTEEAVPTEK